MQRVRSANVKTLQLNARQFTNRLGRLDLPPGSQKRFQPALGCVVGSGADQDLFSQPFEGAPDFDACGPPDYDRVLPEEPLSSSSALAWYADVNDRACVPERRHSPPGPPQWLA